MTQMIELADAIEAAIERYHDALPQGQGEPGDGSSIEKGKALCQLFYDNSELIVSALRTPPGTEERQPVLDERVERVATALCHSGKFACDGRCAPICFEFMGNKPSRCGHAVRVHGDLARAAIAALSSPVEGGG